MNYKQEKHSQMLAKVSRVKNQQSTYLMVYFVIKGRQISQKHTVRLELHWLPGLPTTIYWKQITFHCRILRLIETLFKFV